ncbi:Acyl-coenzyme A thioesterase 8 [Rhodotorula toruloides]|nr:Acyl-coenzyme A thioesterase 8 [Rhodotorula toruloides]
MPSDAPPTAQSITNAIDLEHVDRDLYRSRELWKPAQGRGVFGGQIIAQAAWAATQSVRRDEPGTKKGLHSLHCYFLNFGNADIPVLYQVQRLRDGRSYSTRSVLASQQGVPIFSLTCSFCLAEPDQPVRALPLPHWPLKWHRTEEGQKDPKDVGDRIPEPEDVERQAEERRQSSIELRNTDKREIGHLFAFDKTASQQQLYWFRSRAPVEPDPDFQKCVLAYASDLNFIGTAARATGLGASTKPRLGMLASLDHSMYFYDTTVDAHDWNLFYMNSPVTSNGRGLVHGRIYKRDGTLAVVCTQEGVVRAAL